MNLDCLELVYDIHTISIVWLLYNALKCYEKHYLKDLEGQKESTTLNFINMILK